MTKRKMVISAGANRQGKMYNGSSQEVVRRDGASHPIHQLMLVAMGAHIFDNCDLEAVGEAAAKRK
jgi:hypothetical protein